MIKIEKLPGLLILIALFANNKILALAMLVTIVLSIIIDNKNIKYLPLLIFGFALMSASILVLDSDIRYILPFIAIFFIYQMKIIDDKKSDNNFGGGVILLWAAIILLIFYAELIYGPDLYKTYISYYDDEELLNFSYNIEDISQFRSGVIYHNPNQLAYIILMIFLFNKSIGINKRLLIPMMAVFSLITQSRMLVFFFLVSICGLFIDKNIKLSYKIIFAILILSILYYFDFFLVESRALSTSDNYLEHVLFKIFLLENYYSLDSYQLIFGSGYNRVIHFDADTGSLIYYYGIILSPLIFLGIMVGIYKKYGLLLSIGFLLATTYGTMYTNTRMVVLLGAISVGSQIMRKGNRTLERFYG